MVVTITRQFKLFGVDITSQILNFTINKTTNRLYHTLQLTIRGEVLSKCIEEGCIEDECLLTTNKLQEAIANPNMFIEAIINTDNYKFYIVKVEKQDNGAMAVLAKTKGCLLYPPFSNKSTKKDIGSANIIIKKYLDTKGIEYDLTSADFTIGDGSLEYDGSYGDVIERLAHVTGANYYQKGEKVIIGKAFRIKEDDTPIITIYPNNQEVTAYKETTGGGSKLVKSVLFNEDKEDYTSYPKITLAEDGCSRYLVFNPSPLSKDLIKINQNFNSSDDFQVTERYVIEKDSFKTKGGILSVVSILVDGIPTNDYKFEPRHNIVFFNKKIKGVILISYTTFMYAVQNGEYSLKVRYLDQELIKEITQCSDEDKGEKTDTEAKNNETCQLWVSQDRKSIQWIEGYSPTNILITTNEGGNIQQYGSEYAGNLTIDYYHFSLTERGYHQIDRSSEPYSEKTVIEATKTIYQDRDGLRFKAETQQVTGATVDGVPLNIGHSGYDPKIITISGPSDIKAGDTVKYFVEVNLWTYKLPTYINSYEFWYEVYSCGSKTKIVPLEVANKECTLPTTKTIDIASLTGVPSHQLSGEIVSSDFGDLTINEEGKVQVTINSSGTYTIDVSNIAKDGLITIEAGV